MGDTRFGWSYPAGCSGPPESDEAPCLICGEFPDTCRCPECRHRESDGEECGVVGCIEHLPDRQLVNLLYTLKYRLEGLDQERVRREGLRPMTCPACGHVQPTSMFAEDTILCEKCGHAASGLPCWGSI